MQSSWHNPFQSMPGLKGLSDSFPQGLPQGLSEGLTPEEIDAWRKGNDLAKRLGVYVDEDNY